MDRTQLIDYLYKAGLITRDSVQLTPLSGGVSSDILLVDDGQTRFVLKQSLNKLRVKDDWYCDTIRNVNEYEALRYAATVLNSSVPKLLHGDSEKRLFTMEYFDESYVPWKRQLLAGIIETEIAAKVASLLAHLHDRTWKDTEVQRKFQTTNSFITLRISPYLMTTGIRHPELESLFHAEIQRLQNTELSLVHGDWSAKNMLVRGAEVIVLDWEVAWFGDPAFDAAFLLNLFYLKSLYLRSHCDSFLDLIETFRHAYRTEFKHFTNELNSRICCLTLMLMLARIDGKSPVEYITDEDSKNLVRAFVRTSLLDGVDNWHDFDTRWKKAIVSR